MVATILDTPQKVILDFLPPASDELVDRVLDELHEKYRRQFGEHVLENVNEYCDANKNREPMRDKLSQEFFDCLADHQDEVFGKSQQVYRNVQLIENGDTVSALDFATVGAVTKIHVMGGNKEKRRRCKHNNILRRAAGFFKHYYGPMKQYRIDGREEGGDWNVSVVDIMTGQHVLYRKI